MTGYSAPLSLNEVRFYFTRAAVGAGAPFGIGEDFAAAAAWLACAGVDPGPIVVPALRGLDGGGSAREVLLKDGTTLEAAGSGQLSAIFAGPAVGDLLYGADGSRANGGLRIRNVDAPLLLAAAIAVAKADEAAWQVEWSAADGTPRIAVLAAQGGYTLPDGAAEPPRDIVVGAAEGTTAMAFINKTGRRALTEGVAIDAAAWEVVRRYFSRCLVRSTEESRMSGAGAGLVDRD